MKLQPNVFHEMKEDRARRWPWALLVFVLIVLGAVFVEAVLPRALAESRVHDLGPEVVRK